MEDKSPEPTAKKKTNPILIILYVSLGLELLTLIAQQPSFLSTGIITNGDMSSLTIFIFYFVLIFIVWGIVQLVKKGMHKKQ